MVDYQPIAELVKQIPADTWKILQEIQKRRPAMMLNELYRPELTLTRQGSCIDRASRVADVVVWGEGTHNACFGDP